MIQKNEFYSYLENHDLLSGETVLKLEELTKEFPYFQMGWMLYLKNLKILNAPEYNAVLKKVAVQVSNRKQLYNFLHSKKPAFVEISESQVSTFNLEKEDPEIKGDSLIDKFLLSNPRKIQTKEVDSNQTSEFTPNEILKNSIAENEEIITETLANIYFQQKNYEKALESFQKLSLKYPEKSVYFASRIEEIERIKNI